MHPTQKSFSYTQHKRDILVPKAKEPFLHPIQKSLSGTQRRRAFLTPNTKEPFWHPTQKSHSYTQYRRATQRGRAIPAFNSPSQLSSAEQSSSHPGRKSSHRPFSNKGFPARLPDSPYFVAAVRWYLGFPYRECRRLIDCLQLEQGKGCRFHAE